eukprot:jgi/Tetstr1/450186/TSEL_037227.t1
MTSQGVRRAKLNMGRRQAFRGCRMLPYMDDFQFFVSSRAQAYAVRDRLTCLLGPLGPADPPTRANVRFNLRELHDVLRTKDSWSERVKMTHQLRRDLEWWVAVPNHSNGRSI